MDARMTISHRIIAALMAAWIPFCCCTLKVAGGMLLQDEATVAMGCCGHGTNTCSKEGTDPAEDTDESCVGCCIKILPEAPEKWEPPVDLGEPQIELQSVDDRTADRSGAFLRTMPPRPPDPPPVRTLLEQRCLLLV